jgi:hypothetical protein
MRQELAPGKSISTFPASCQTSAIFTTQICESPAIIYKSVNRKTFHHKLSSNLTSRVLSDTKAQRWVESGRGQDKRCGRILVFRGLVFE